MKLYVNELDVNEYENKMLYTMRIISSSMKVSIDEAIELVKKGSIIGFPTETVYGFGGILNNATIKSLHKLKNTDGKRPFQVMVGSCDDVYNIAHTNDIFEVLKNFYPLPLSLVMKSNNSSIPYDKVAVRIAGNPKAMEVIGECGPLFTTSANLSDDEPIVKCKELVKTFSNIPILCGDDEVVYKTSSTVIDIIESPKVLREGAIGSEKLEIMTGLKFTR